MPIARQAGRTPISPASEKRRRRKPKRRSSSDTKLTSTRLGDRRDEAERATGRHPHEGVASGLISVSALPRSVGRTRSQFSLGGDDKLYGLAGNDFLDGGKGNDVLDGALGNDVLVGGPGADRFRCGAGRDVARAGAGDTVARDCEVVKGLPKTPPSPPAPPPPAPPSTCEITQDRSSPSTTPAAIEFVNQTGGSVNVYWLSFDGSRQFWFSLAAGRSQNQGTYIGHAWLVTDAAGVCVGFVVANQAQARYVIRTSGSPPPLPQVPVTSGSYKGLLEGNFVFFEVLSDRTITGFRSNYIREDCNGGTYIYGTVNWGTARYPIRADGTFSFSASYQGTIGGVPGPASFFDEVTGRFDGTSATGTVLGTSEFDFEGTHYSCTSGRRTWTASLQP